MFETAELGRTVSKKVFKKSEPMLRQELLEIQRELRQRAPSQVIVVFAGVDGAGKGEIVNLLNEWMDSRWLINRVFDELTDVERELPDFWRYWRALPPRGRIGIFLSSYYSNTALLPKVYDEIDDARFDHNLDRIISFENALIDDGAIILKFWMHLSRAAQEARLTSLEKDALRRARVTERDWEHWKMYDKFVNVAERLIMRTNTGKAPWNIVEGADENYRSLTVGTILRDTLRRRMEEVQIDAKLKPELKARIDTQEERDTDRSKKKARQEDIPAGDAGETQEAAGSLVTVLTNMDMSKRLNKEELTRRQAELHQLHLQARAQGVSTILVFEGTDAAGKGGAIRRLTAAMDARNYQVHGFAAPTDEEKAQHYLWRFWRHLERAGRFTIFDRSWYGRVLVERVEGFATEDEWRRAYAEINDFEAQLCEHGTVLVKFWIHITPEEQLARFKSREQTPHKAWKLTDEDWRNREKREDYELAVNDMVQYTSTPVAPWTLVEGNDKRYARVKVIDTVCERLQQALDHNSPAAALSG